MNLNYQTWHRTTLTLAALLVALLIAVILEVTRYSHPREGNPATGSHSDTSDHNGDNESQRTIAQGGLPTDPPDPPTAAYPGGNTPEPAPTQTHVPAGQGKYDGWSGQQIANDLIARYEGATPQRAIPPTAYVTSRIITPTDAGKLGINPALISYQSPTDYAIVLSGQFPNSFPGSRATPLPPAPHMLVVVDIASGAVRKFKFSTDIQALLSLLPPP